jgi:ferric-dicitrate binding protein FerR (iron transport regulator)
MNIPSDQLSELQALCEAVVEDQLTLAQRQRLEQLVFADAQARRFYVEYLHQHACLQWSVADGQDPGVIRPVRNVRAGLRRAVTAFVVAACLLLAVGAWLVFLLGNSSAPVATLADGKACKWESGTLPTEIGTRLGRGRLRLAEGLARIVFDSGAEITLEGPADLEIMSAQRCVLQRGRLVSEVPPPAIGFVVDTPSAVLKDLGTEFSIHVHETGVADVHVFKGLVDVRHRPSGEERRMQVGEELRFGRDAIAEFDPMWEEKPAAVRGSAPAEGMRLLHLTTALGRGKDAYVVPLDHPPQNNSDILLLVKNTVDDKPPSDWVRKAYLGFDLAPLAGMTVVEARLTLTFAPTNMGFASEVPDAVFRVFGLTDEMLEGWDERTLRWANAPANAPGGAAVDPQKVVCLGDFEMAQGVQMGARGISSPALVDFLNRRAGELATLIVVRETKGSGRQDLVHGFASRRHPQLPPPTLNLMMAPQRRP